MGRTGQKTAKNSVFYRFRGAKYTKKTVFEGRISHKSVYIQPFTQKCLKFANTFRSKRTY